MSSSAEATAFGGEVRRRRTSLGMTLADLSACVGIGPNYLGRIEMDMRRRDVPLGMAVKIAKALNSTLQELLGGFEGLSAQGIEAGRLLDVMPVELRAPALALLRAIARRKGRQSGAPTQRVSALASRSARRSRLS